jgi:histidine triad (HIT) family protein
MVEEEIDTGNMSVEEMNDIQKQNCIFCKIANKQIPAKILHEDDKVICILDINPASEGHILIYPKEHYMILPHIPEDIVKHMFRIVKLMSNTLLKTLQCGGTSIFIANGVAAGQKAPHVLIHVFPRREGDGLLELPKYEMSADQSNNLKKSMTPYLNQLFGKNMQNVVVKEDKNVPVKENKSTRNVHTNIDEEKFDDKNTDVKRTAKKSTQKDTNKKSLSKTKDRKNVDLDDIAKLFGG